MKASKGFTLIELLVVIVIVGILAAIAIPAFLSQVDKAKHSEAKINISTLIRFQMVYYTKHGKWAANKQLLDEPVPDTDNYFYRTHAFKNHEGRSGATAIAIPKSNVKGYMAKIWLEDDTFDQTFICEGEYGETYFMQSRTISGCP
jgi:type IV pilus assembly protein PilA